MKLRNLFEQTSPEVQAFADSVKQKYGLVDFDLYDDDRGNIELNRIQVARGERKGGTGTAVMQELANFADKRGSLIWMSVADKNDEMGTTSKSRLMKFYRQFGFKPNKGRNKRYDLSMYASMYRDPR